MIWIKSENFESELRLDIKDYLIEIEWQKRQQAKLKPESEKKSQQEKEKKQEIKQETQEIQSNWQANTENRVNSWRNFQQKAQ